VPRSDRTGPYELGDNPTLTGISRNWARKVRLSMRTHCPATLVAYDPATQTATVTIDILGIVKVFTGPPGVDPNLVNLTKPSPPYVLTGIPVVFPSSGDSKGYLTFPLLPGSTGYVEVMDRGLQTWLDRMTPIPVDPVESATHALADSIFVPGLTDNLHRIVIPTDMVGARLHHDVQTTISAGTTVKLGGTAATLGVARLTDPVTANADMVTFMTMVVTALTTIAAAVPVVIVTPIPPATTMGTITTASTKVKSE